MPEHRRLTAALSALSLGWAVLALGVTTPAAQAEVAPVAVTQTVSSATSSVTAEREPPHDPATYYAGTSGLSGATLAAKLHTIIAGHTKLSYAAVYTALPITDPDPSNPSTYLTDFYSGTPVLSSDRCGSSCGTSGWNREHTWPQSHGDFGTSAGIGTDLFHMRPEFGSTNSSRGNLDFDNTTTGTVPLCADCRRDSDSFMPRDAVKGDLARGLFYMAVRYEGDSGELNLKMNDLTCNGAGTPNMGKLSTLVAWSQADPPDDRERTRNDLVDGTYQHNRNPFIDHPEWVTSIFGNGVGLGPSCGSTSGSDYVAGGTTPVNNAPTTSPMTGTTQQGTAVSVPLTASDIDGDPLTWTISTPPTSGTATVSGSNLTFTPAAGFTGSVPIGVTVSDGRGGAASTTVTITVSATTPTNQAPTASPVTGSTPQGTATSVALNGSDPDGDPLTWTVSNQSPSGSATVSGSTLTFTPNAGFTGTATVGVTVTDGRGGSATTTVTITVTAVTPGNTTPVASNVSVTTPRNGSSEIGLVGSDVEDTDLVFTVATQPAHGTVTVSGRTATYTPTTGYTGTDSFTYTVRDTAGATSAPATVSITVTASSNNAPVTTSGTATTAENTATTVTLSATDADGDALTYTITGPPAHGSVTLAGTQATYTPATDYVGPDSFTWSVYDGQATVTGTTTVTVTEVTNQAPTITGTTLHTTPGAPVTVTLADLGAADLDGDTVTITGVSAPTLGTATASPTAVTYTPGARWGTDTFVVRVTDGQGGTAAATVTVDIAARTAEVRVTAPTTTRGARGAVTITATGTDATTPTGTVTLTSGDTVLATPALGSDGTATVSFVPARAGVVPLVATYDGDDLYGPATSPSTTWTVTRSAAKLSLAAGTLKRGAAGVVKATVRTIAGVPATGKVTLTAAGKTLTAKLVKGVATFKIAKLPRTAQLKVVARYAGDTQYVAGSATHTYPLKK